MSKIFEWLNTPKIKPSTFMFTIIGIIYYIFMETAFFSDLSDDWRTLIFIAITVGAALLGVSIGSLKEFSSELNNIIKDSKLTPDQKVNELTNLAIRVNTQLGLAWESYNLTAKSSEATLDNRDQIQEQINQLEEQLEELGE